MSDKISLENIKNAKLEGVADFLKSNEQLKILTKDFIPASVDVRAGKDFVEIKILMATKELAASIVNEVKEDK